MSRGGSFGGNKNLGQRIVDNAAGQLTNLAGTRPVGKYMTGARTILRVNKKLIGFAFSISWRIDTAQMEITTIDDYLPAEIAPTRVQVTGTIGGLHIPGRSASKEQFQSNVLSFLAHQYIEIEVRDSQTNELLFYTPKAVINSRQEGIQAGAHAQTTLQFMAIGWKDELQPTLPKGINGDENGAQSATASAIDKIKRLF